MRSICEDHVGLTGLGVRSGSEGFVIARSSDPPSSFKYLAQNIPGIFTIFTVLYYSSIVVYIVLVKGKLTRVVLD
jgi:hypothetical protein